VKIAEAIGPSDQLTLVERNEQFVAHLRARLDDDPSLKSIADRTALLHASVEDLPDEPKYDVIVSGLPLNNFSVELVEQILTKLQGLLAPRGTLSFFEYVAIRRARSLVSAADTRQRLRGISRIFDELFREQEIRRDLVLTNVPPAWVHHLRFAHFPSGGEEQPR
jgi:phospholipid N-methyltransferase